MIGLPRGFSALARSWCSSSWSSTSLCAQIDSTGYRAGARRDHHRSHACGFGSTALQLWRIPVIGSVVEAVITVVVAIVLVMALTSLRDASRLAGVRQHESSGAD
jgi:aspartate aminotransferase-like enzyme